MRPQADAEVCSRNCQPMCRDFPRTERGARPLRQRTKLRCLVRRGNRDDGAPFPLSAPPLHTSAAVPERHFEPCVDARATAQTQPIGTLSRETSRIRDRTVQSLIVPASVSLPTRVGAATYPRGCGYRYPRGCGYLQCVRVGPPGTALYVGQRAEGDQKLDRPVHRIL